MDLNELRQLVAWVEASGFHRFELTRPEGSITFDVAVPDAGTIGVPFEGGPPESAPHADAGIAIVAADTAGRFVTTHPSCATPFATVGASVRQGDVLGLLRIGVLLAPVIAPTDGTVAAIVAADGSLQDYGAPLLELRMRR